MDSGRHNSNLLPFHIRSGLDIAAPVYAGNDIAADSFLAALLEVRIQVEEVGGSGVSRDDSTFPSIVISTAFPD